MRAARSLWVLIILERVLNVLADAVTKGELDTQLASAAANRKKAGRKSA